MCIYRRVLAVMLFALAALLAGLALEPGEALAQPASLVGRPAPLVRATSLDGEDVVVPVRGKVMLVVFWNTKYRLSANALGAVQRVYDRYRGRGLLCVGIDDLGEDERAIGQFAAGVGAAFPMVGRADGRSAAVAYRVRGVPVVYLIDKSGSVFYVKEGWDTNAEEEIGRKLGAAL